MKKLFLPFNLFIFFTLLAFWLMPGRIETFTLEKLKDFGYPNASIGNVSLGLTLKNVTLEDISLDEGGKNFVPKAEIVTLWPLFLFNKSMDSITIENAQIHYKVSAPTPFLWFKNKEKLQQFYALPISHITLKNTDLHLETSQGNIPLRLDGSVTQNDTQKDLEFTLTSQSNILGLNSKWEGHLKDKQQVKLDGSIEQFQLNLIPIDINRATGWLSYSNNPEKPYLSGQIDAGSGALFETPIKNINILLGQNENYYPIVFRAAASGVEGIDITADLDVSALDSNHKFSASMNIDKGTNFMTYLDKIHGKQITSFPADNLDSSTLLLSYLHERRFTDGPLPFEIAMTQDQKDIMNGTVLIYPDSWDVRGTAETKNNLIKLLKPLLNIPSEKISDNVIRLDGNLSGLLVTNN